MYEHQDIAAAATLGNILVLNAVSTYCSEKTYSVWLIFSIQEAPLHYSMSWKLPAAVVLPL